MWTDGAMPAASACSAWARPISRPSMVAAEFSDMFCDLNGATRVAPLSKDAAKRGRQKRFADVRAGSKDHDGAGVAHFHQRAL